MREGSPEEKENGSGLAYEKVKRGQALPIDISNFLTSFLMSGRPAAVAQYRQTRLGSPM